MGVSMTKDRGSATMAEPTDGGDVKFVRLLYVDFGGVRRCRIVPADKLPSICKSGIGMAKANVALMAGRGGIAPNSGLTPTGELRMMPIVPPKRLMWYPTHSIALVELHDRPGSPSPLCPVAALQRALDLALSDHGLTLRFGFESEFVLLKGQQPAQQAQHALQQPTLPGNGHAAAAQADPRRQRAMPEAVDKGGYCRSAALDSQCEVLDEIVDALCHLGIAVDQMHAESGGGQFEVVASHGDAMSAVHSLVLLRETIACIAQRRGLLASFLPKVFKGQGGSGCHCHISLQKDGQSVMASDSGKHGLSAPSTHFMAGVLRHLPALMVFLVGSVNSYERIKPCSWSGGYQVWGVNNREATLRLCETPGSSASMNVELKTLDATANPYVAMAGVIAAGLLGIKHKAQLPRPVNVDPGALSSKEREELSVLPLPATMDEALQALASDKELKPQLEAVLGPELLQAVCAIRAADSAHYAKASFEDVVLALHDCY